MGEAKSSLTQKLDINFGLVVNIKWLESKDKNCWSLASTWQLQKCWNWILSLVMLRLAEHPQLVDKLSKKFFEVKLLLSFWVIWVTFFYLSGTEVEKGIFWWNEVCKNFHKVTLIQIKAKQRKLCTSFYLPNAE